MSVSAQLALAVQNASALAAQGDRPGATELLDQALEAATAVLGAGHPDVLAATRALARLHAEAGEPLEARRLLDGAVAAGQFHLGDGHPTILGVFHDLGMVASDLGNLHEARKNFGRVVQYGPAVLGQGHEYVTTAARYLGVDPASAGADPAAQPAPGSGEPAGHGAPDLAGAAGAAGGGSGGTAPAGGVPGAAAAAGIPVQPTATTAPDRYGGETADPWTYSGPAQVRDPRAAELFAPRIYQPPADPRQVQPAPPGTTPPIPQQPIPQQSALGQVSAPPVGYPGQVSAAPYPVSTAPYPVSTPPLPRQASAPPYPPLSQRRAPAAADPFDDDPLDPVSGPAFTGSGERRQRRVGVLLMGAAAVLALLGAGFAAVTMLGTDRGADPGRQADGASVAASAAPSEPAPSPTPAGAAPTGLRLKDNGSSVTLSWQDPAAGQVQFIVAGGQGTDLRALRTTRETTFTLNGLNPRLDYCFTVAAVYDTNQVAVSDLACTQRGGSSQSAPASKRPSSPASRRSSGPTA